MSDGNKDLPLLLFKMNRLVQENSWYGFSDLSGNWAAINFGGWIDSSIGRIELPVINGVRDIPLYLVGCTWGGVLLMGGQSQNGNGTLFYVLGQWYVLDPRSFGTSPSAFNQDGSMFYSVLDAQTVLTRDSLTGAIAHIPLVVFTDGLRAVVPPNNKIIIGNTTNYSPEYDLYQFIDFGNGLVVGQGQNGLTANWLGTRYLIESGDTFFIRAMFDGFNIALATVKQSTKQLVNWWLDTAELVNFPVDNEITVPDINKPCWLGWFEFVNDPNPVAPANSLLRIHDGGSIKKMNGEQFAQWVQGDSVESIEGQCASNPLPCVAYWDGRSWPRWPVIKPNDYLALQAYCFKDEIPSDFEANMRALINSAPAHYNNICLVCQCYTSNAALTTNLIGIVPVFASLARDYPRVTMLLTFSDQGRATGLNDHPEVRPYWQQLYEGITGEPQVPDEDPAILPVELYNDLVRLRPNYPTPMGFRAAELLNEVALLHPGWGLESKQGGTVCAQPQTGITCGCDILRLPNSGYDCLTDAEGACIPKQGARGPAEPSRFVEPVGNVPEPGQIDLRFQSYQTLVHRSDPKGFTIYWDMDSPRPITQFEVQLLGAPEVFRLSVTPPFPPDGRYFRGLSWKPTMNGVFTPRLTVWDDQGNSASVDGVQVEVVP